MLVIKGFNINNKIFKSDEVFMAFIRSRETTSELPKCIKNWRKFELHRMANRKTQLFATK